MRTRLDVLGNGFIGLTAGDKRILAATEDGHALSGAHSDVLGADVSLPIGEVWSASGFGSFSSAGTVDDALVGGSTGIEIERSPAFGTAGSVALTDFSPGYRNELGFLTQSGISLGEAELEQRYRIGEAGFAGSSGVVAEGWVERDQDRYQAAGLAQRLVLTSNHDIEATLLQRTWDFEGTEVRGSQLEVEYDALVNRYLGFEVTGNVGRELDFGPTSRHGHAAGRRTEPASVRVDPARPVLRAAVVHTGRPRPGPSRALLRATDLADDEVSRHTDHRPDPDGNGHRGPFSAGQLLLLTWLKHPGTEAYIGTTWTVETDGRGLTEQAIFAKYSTCSGCRSGADATRVRPSPSGPSCPA